MREVLQKKKDVLEKEITEVIERKESSDKAQLLKLEGWGKIIKKHPYILITSLYAIAMVFIYLLMTREGFYPWGSDTWGHLFKGHFLYKEFVKGNFFPLYTDLWYNGIQPFRYWAPIPYYILLLFELVTSGDSLKAYYLFIALTFITGALPWIWMGRDKGRIYFGALLGILWFILPDNLRVTFLRR